MLRRLARMALMVGAALSITACNSTSTSPMTNIEKGKACFEAGGSWVPYSDHGGHMMCEFKQEVKP